MKRWAIPWLCTLLLVSCWSPRSVGPENPKSIILATTTSTQDSGLLDALVPAFEKQTGYTVKVIAVGTGAALAMGQKGDADVLLVHDPASEMGLVASGDVVERRLVMYNDFILVGPADDPAQAKGTQILEAFRRIYKAQALFISRGDNSGTHKKERELWADSGLSPGGAWYQETGQGMGATLKIASEKGAYTLADRGTYLAMGADLHLAIIAEGDPRLYNVYHVMVVNPQKHPEVNAVGGKAFAAYLVSPEAQNIIGLFGQERFGQPLFFPAAGKPDQPPTTR